MLVPDCDPTSIADERLRATVVALLNLVESLAGDLHEARAEIQRLRDEVNRLKGEQGKPDVKPNRPQSPPADHSSERERHTPTRWTKGSKIALLPIDREEVCRLDPATLPADAVFKGYDDVIVQDLVLRRDTIRFRKRKYYSPSAKTSYLAPLPPGYRGQFGPGVRTLILDLYYAGQMTEPKLLAFLTSIGIAIAAGELSNLLIQDQDAFHAEKAALYRAGLASSPWQHIDDTSTRVNGQNQVCHIVCNPLFTAYFTLPAKDRLSVIDVLRDLGPRRFRVNGAALAYLAATHLPLWVQQQVAQWPQEQDWDEATLAARLERDLPGLGPQQAKWLRDALAVAAYHATVDFPVVRLLVCDDAPQFKGVTDDLGLCWVHEGRHYAKLLPFSAAQRDALDRFRGRFWAYYRGLLRYQAQPTAVAAVRLSAGFDRLCATQTSYGALNERIAATRDKKDWLLLALRHPEIALHNNPAELGARQRVRKRDVSYGPRTTAGVQAWDTFQSLVETARKLGLSCYAYFADRVRQAGLVPRLDLLIIQRAEPLHLGKSWLAADSPANY